MLKYKWSLIALFTLLLHLSLPIAEQNYTYRFVMSVGLGLVFGMIYILENRLLNEQSNQLLRGQAQKSTRTVALTRNMTYIHLFIIPMIALLMTLNYFFYM
jgi:hypothetical protein